MYTNSDNMKDNQFFSQIGFHSEMFYQHFLARLFFKTEEVLSPPARRRRLRRLRLRPVKF